MKWLLRTVVALSLLACLGYASYAFGLYVLSKKLFGDTIMQKSPDVSAARSAKTIKSVTRKSPDQSGQPRVEVNVLDAREAGPGPEAPSLDSMERDTRARDYDTPRAQSRQRIVTADSLKTVRRTYRKGNPQEVRDGSSRSDEERPRRRRRRRRRRVTTETNSTSASNARRESGATESTVSSSDSSSGDSSSSSERPRERDSSSSDTPRRERRIESPVPDSGGSGSSQRESPVPVPE
jgi:hypothetical protein